MRSSGVESEEQDKPGAEPSAGEAEGAAKRQRKRAPHQPDRPNRGFHQLLGREFLDRRAGDSG